MKTNWIHIIIVAVVSAVCTSLIWKWVDFRSVKDVETEYVYKTTVADDLFSGRIQESFASAVPTNFILASSLATPAVVSIQARLGGAGLWERHRFSQSTGSGVIISPDGFIVTNHHVIENGSSIKVTLNDKKEYEAKVVGTDPSTDLALLKINARDVPFLVFGNSDSLQIGEWVLAVGNPFRLESTVTAGIVSAKARNINILEADYPIESFIQTDAVVNPGNSGGALVNTLGELIGINTAIITQSGKYEGYSFAVPSNLAQKVIYDLKEFGKVQRGLLGVAIDNISDERARELLLPEVKGVQIIRVSPGGSADEGGMLKNDVITSINGIETKSVPELQEIVGRYRPGDKLSLTFYRKGKEQKTDIILRNPIISLLADVGFELRELTPDERREIGTRGVLVVSIDKGSKIDRTNMDPGFIITKANDVPVESIEKFTEILRDARGRMVLEGLYKKYKGEYYYAFSLD
jgi:serine protease Do